MKLLLVLAFSFLTTSVFATDCVFVVQVDNSDMFGTEMSLIGNGTVSASIGAATGIYTRDEASSLETLTIVMPDGSTSSQSHKLDSLSNSGLVMNSENIVVSLICTK